MVSDRPSGQLRTVEEVRDICQRVAPVYKLVLEEEEALAVTQDYILHTVRIEVTRGDLHGCIVVEHCIGYVVRGVESGVCNRVVELVGRASVLPDVQRLAVRCDEDLWGGGVHKIEHRDPDVLQAKVHVIFGHTREQIRREFGVHGHARIKKHPDLCVPTNYVEIVLCAVISVGPEWYYIVSQSYLPDPPEIQAIQCRRFHRIDPRVHPRIEVGV